MPDKRREKSESAGMADSQVHFLVAFLEMARLSSSLIIASIISVAIGGLSKKDLLDELAFKQVSRSTFDSRIHQKVKPIGFIGDKPIWPRVLDHVESSAELFFDDDNFAYRMNHVGPEHLVRYLDSKDKFEKVLEFIDRAVDRDGSK